MVEVGEDGEVVDILNDALALIGGGAIFSLDDDDELVEHCRRVWSTKRDALLAWARFNFTMQTVRLDRKPGEPANGYRCRHWLPADRVGLPTKYLTNPRDPRRPLREFSVEGDVVTTDFDDLWARTPMRISVKNWPALFRDAAVTGLAAALAIPVAHDKDLSELLFARAFGSRSEQFRGGLMGIAIADDAARGGGPSPMYADDPLTTAHRSGGAWHGGD